jgi:hypothetical protein
LIAFREKVNSPLQYLSADVHWATALVQKLTSAASSKLVYSHVRLKCPSFSSRIDLLDFIHDCLGFRGRWGRNIVLWPKCKCVCNTIWTTNIQPGRWRQLWPNPKQFVLQDLSRRRSRLRCGQPEEECG